MVSNPCSGAPNITECLLYELWRQQSKPNFGQKTFGFTVTFTVLAFFIASVALFQGALFAGTGRLKASHRAIGDFNKYTSKWYKWHQFPFSLREFRFRTTTMVPFFRFPAIRPVTVFNEVDKKWWEKAYTQTPAKTPKATANNLGGNEPQAGITGAPPSSPVVESEADLERGQDTQGQNTHGQNNPKITIKPRSKQATIYAASWANLLENFDKSLPLFEYESPNRGNSLVFCDTEYLPSDIPAAPASGNVETIITIAALAGCDMIKSPIGSGGTRSQGPMETVERKEPRLEDYPSALGSNLQLTFHKHPQLGTFAIFRKFPGPATFNQKRSIPELFFECYLPGHSEVFKHLTVEAEIPTLLDTKPRWPRVLAFSKKELNRIARLFCSHSKAWKTLDVRVIIASLVKHFDRSRGTSENSHSYLHWRVDGHDAGDWPRTSMYAFDYSDMSLVPQGGGEGEAAQDQSLGPDFVGDDPWTSQSYKTTKRPPMTTMPLDKPDDRTLSKHKISDRAGYLEKLVQLGGKVGNFEPTKPPEHALVIIPLAIFSCLYFIGKEPAFNHLKLGSKAAMRGALRWQLNEIDNYLYTYCQLPMPRDITFSNILARLCRKVHETARSTSTTLRGDPSFGPGPTPQSADFVRDLRELHPEIPDGRKKTMKDAQDWLDREDDGEDEHVPGNLSLEEITELEKIYDVIVFRVVVMAAFLCTATDVGEVVGTEVGKRIVNFA